MNASIDIGADGTLIYRLDPALGESVEVSRQGDVYTMTSPAPIDLASNAAGLVVTGSGTTELTVAGPSGLRIVAAADGQEIDVRSTGVPTSIDIQADGVSVVLGDVTAAGLRALSAPVSVSAAAGTTGSDLTVSDGAGAYDPGGVLRYIITATTVEAQGIEGFAGISYAGLASLRLSGTSSRSAPSALYLVKGTADGAATTIDGTGGFGRDFSIVGMSSDPSSSLTLLAAGEANVWASYVGSPTVFAGGSRSSIWIEGIRDGARGLQSSFVVDAAAGGVDLNVGPYWNGGGAVASTFWILESGRAGPSPFARLQEYSGPGAAGVFYRPDQAEELEIDARGGSGRGSLLVDFYGGDPLPASSLGLGRGLVYFGAPQPEARLGYALGFVSTPPEGAFSEELHVAMPLYRGTVELTKSDGTKRHASFQLAEGSPQFNDGVGATTYRRVDRYDGVDPSVRADSDLRLTPGRSQQWSRGSRYALEVFEANPGLRMAGLTLTSKADVSFLRGRGLGETTTTLDYAGYGRYFDGTPWRSVPEAPAGLERFSIENGSPGGASSQVVRLHAAPSGVATAVEQGAADAAVVVLSGVAPAASVSLRGGDGSGTLYVDATGVPLAESGFVDLGGGWTRVVQPGATPVDFRGYGGVEVYHPATPAGVQVDGLAFPTDAGQAHVDVAAAVMTTAAGFSTAELSATIEWGDSTVDYATFQPVAGEPGSFRIVGTHAYATAGVATPNVWVAGQVAWTTAIHGVSTAFHVPIAPARTSERPMLTVGLPRPAFSIQPPYAEQASTNQDRPTFQGESQLGPGSRVDVYAVARDSGGASGSVMHLGTANVNADSRWSLVSTEALAYGIYDVYATSSSDSTRAMGVGRGPEPGMVVDTRGPRIVSLGVKPRAGEIVVRVRSLSGAAWGGGARLVTADGREVPTTNIGSIYSPNDPRDEHSTSIKTAEPLAPGEYILTITAARPPSWSGVFDNAGNSLDGAFDGTFPTGGANTGRDFRARLLVGPDDLISVRPA